MMQVAHFSCLKSYGILSGPTRETVASLFYSFFCEQKLHQVISTKLSSYHRLLVLFCFSVSGGGRRDMLLENRFVPPHTFFLVLGRTWYKSTFGRLIMCGTWPVCLPCWWQVTCSCVSCWLHKYIADFTSLFHSVHARMSASTYQVLTACPCALGLRV